ncbi:MAG: hypothetical protein ACRD1X_01640 [Vicinamibacteria bacterium]
MKNLTPREIAEKQVRKSQAATEDYVRGVEAVTEAPGVRAVKKKDKLKANFAKAIDSGKWEENTLAAGLDGWKEPTRTKGAERYASGVAASLPKLEAFHDEFIPFLRSHTAKIDAMPDATVEQRLTKMRANAEGISKFKRTRRRR